jgi:N-dimethylarginine dimethylaminohydrolase
MKTYDITNSIKRHYPELEDLLSEKEFKSYLDQEGIEISETALRDYRHRDKKFAYIRKGHQVFYPLHVNKQIIKEIKEN